MRYLMLLLGALFLTSCAHRVYETAEIETIAEKHTTIAIIQPKVDYKFYKPDHKNWQFVPKKEEIGAGIQFALTNWIETHKERGVLDITIMDIELTNKILAESITTDYGQLARDLGVDAVLVSRLNYDTSYDYEPWKYRFDERNPQSRISLNLFTPAEGLIWSYDRAGFHPSNNYTLIVSELLAFAAREMPYAVAK